MKRCKSCLTKTKNKTGVCPVCGTDQDKKKNALSPAEAKVRRSARNIRGVAQFHLVLSMVGMGSLLIARAWEQLPDPFVVQMSILVFCYCILMITAFGLVQYRYWAYKISTTFYFLIGIVFTISVQIPGILIILTLLYLIGNGTAKALFERRADDMRP